jgi:hypothetical protein
MKHSLDKERFESGTADSNAEILQTRPGGHGSASAAAIAAAACLSSLAARFWRSRYQVTAASSVIAPPAQ